MASPSDARILIVTAHDATRLGLVLILSRQPWVADCWSTTDSTEAATLARRHGPSVVVVELSPLAGPIVEAIRTAHPQARFVINSQCTSSVAKVAQQFGAAGVLTPSATRQDVVDAVRAAAASEPRRSPEPGSNDEFSDREREVLGLLIMGETNQEIATALHLGRESVKKYAGSIYRKVGVRNRTELARRMIGQALH